LQLLLYFCGDTLQTTVQLRHLCLHLVANQLREDFNNKQRSHGGDQQATVPDHLVLFSTPSSPRKKIARRAPGTNSIDKLKKLSCNNSATTARLITPLSSKPFAESYISVPFAGC